jgi:putative membrane protein
MQSSDSRTTLQGDTPALPLLAVRGGIGGVLMGLANLVPGISGGTMLLAAGVYPRFINAIGEVTVLRFRKASVVLLLSVVLSALVAIVLLAGPVKDLVVDHRWVMYSLFIGLTLGGVPVVWRLIRPRSSAGPGVGAEVWVSAVCGFIAMSALAYFQMRGGGGAERAGFMMMLFAGVAGASAMILPGVSGGYLLLVLGVYVPILNGISLAKDAAKAGDIGALMEPVLGVVLPVGLGVVVGVVAVSNVLRLLLRRYEKQTLGVLLGLLLGAVVGLWPFQQGVAPEVGSVLKGQTVVVDDAGGLVFEGSGKAVEADDYGTEVFNPTAVQVMASAGLVVVGFLITLGVDRVGGGKGSGDEKVSGGDG